MHAKSMRPSAKREVQKERSAKRDDRIARPRRAQTCERSELRALRMCARSGQIFFNWEKKINTSGKWILFGRKLDIFTQPKVHDAKTKSLMCQNGLFTICLSLIHDVLDMSKWTSTYCWSHLFANSGNL